MKKLYQVLGTMFMIGGIAFFLILSFVVTGSSDESFARDLFGFPIPQPPLWTYFIPFLGGFLGFSWYLAKDKKKQTEGNNEK